MALESWGLLGDECEGQRKASEQGESSTQRLCQGNDNLFLFSWLKTSWRHASVTGGVASFWGKENPGLWGLFSSEHAGASQKSGSCLG